MLTQTVLCVYVHICIQSSQINHCWHNQRLQCLNSSRIWKRVVNLWSDLIGIRAGSSEVVELLEDGVLFLDRETTWS